MGLNSVIRVAFRTTDCNCWWVSSNDLDPSNLFPLLVISEKEKNVFLISCYSEI